ncbi:MAG: hypothetical protein ACHQNT_00860 [Bacteroidia bacterium]
MNTADWIGTTGVFILLLAFFMNAFSFIKKDSKIYFGMNFAGAAIACYASILINFLPFVMLEGVWCLVSVVAFIKTPNHVG